MYLLILRLHLKKKNKISERHQMMLMRYFVGFFLIFFIKAYVVGTHFNCIDAIQMDIHNIYLFKEVDRKYIGCNLKPTESLDCALI